MLAIPSGLRSLSSTISSSSRLLPNTHCESRNWKTSSPEFPSCFASPATIQHPAPESEGPVKPANYKRAASVIDRVFDQTRTPLPYELLELEVVRKVVAAFHWGRSERARACRTTHDLAALPELTN